MVYMNIVNVTVELTCLAVSLTLIISLIATKAYKDKFTRIFFTLVLINSFILIFDAIAWSFDGRQGDGVISILRISNLLVYILGQLYAIFLARYIISYIAKRREGFERTARPLMISIVVISLVMAITTVALQFTDFLYTFDENNVMQFGPLTKIFNALAFFEMLALLSTVLLNRKYLNRKDIGILLVLHLFTFAGLIIENIYQDFMAIYLFATLAFVVMYASIQVQSEVAAAQKESDAKTAIMISQIQPHFLYNSLSSIAVLCDENPAEAKRAVISFSEYLRGNMNSLGFKEPIQFTKELEHVKYYLTLELRRFRDRLRVSYDINATNFSLPALTLQPIVENAVRHGIQNQRQGGLVAISSREEPEGFVVTVTDTGAGFQIAEVSEHGLGIANVKARLAAMCGGTLSIESAPGEGTTASIWIPKRRRD